jgi:hypothetical protein
MRIASQVVKSALQVRNARHKEASTEPRGTFRWSIANAAPPKQLVGAVGRLTKRCAYQPTEQAALAKCLRHASAQRLASRAACQAIERPRYVAKPTPEIPGDHEASPPGTNLHAAKDIITFEMFS